MKVRRVVMQSVSETDGIAGMKFLGEFPHDFLQAGMQNLVGIDPNGHQRVVLFFRHREDQPMRDDRAFRLRGNLSKWCCQASVMRRLRSALESCAGAVLLPSGLRRIWLCKNPPA